MPWLVEGSFDAARSRLERERLRLTFLEAENSKLGHVRGAAVDWSMRSAKAYSYVFQASVFEDLIRNLDSQLVADLFALNPPRGGLPPSIVAAIMPDRWRGLNTAPVDFLRARTELISLIVDHAAVVDSVAHPDVTTLGLSDGHTVAPHHLEALWSVLGLASPCFPSLTHKTALKEIALRRNDIAHWNDDPQVVSAKKTFGDLIRLTALSEEIVDHLELEIVDWLDSL